MLSPEITVQTSGPYKFTEILEWEALGVTDVHSSPLQFEGMLLPGFHEARLLMCHFCLG